jgi:hypothetical protein
VGAWRTWHPNGALHSEGRYRDGLLHGRWRYWSTSGRKLAEGAYRRGQRHGVWHTWHDSGVRASQEGWREGAREGVFRSWDETGRLTSHGSWRRGRREGRWRFDAGNGRFETQWFRGAPTNRPGNAPRQPAAERDHFYPVVPGQAGSETPFDTPGHAAGRCFGYVEGLRKLTYLFCPPAPIDPFHAGGLFLAIAERRQVLWLLEKRFAAGPGASPGGRMRSRGYRPRRFVVFSDPLVADSPAPVVEPTLAAARRSAREGVLRDGIRRAVGALIGEYPLDD